MALSKIADAARELQKSEDGMARNNQTEQKGVETWVRHTGRQPGERPDARAIVGRLDHGIFAFRIFGEDKKKIFSEIIDAFLEEFTLNRSVDFVQLELVGIYSLQLIRAIAQEKWEAAERVDRMLRHHLDDLKVTKRAREGDGASESRTSPLALAMSLLERAKARQAEEETADAEKTPETLQRTSGESDEAHA
ncbi:MAG TPA: hypothetical protein VGL77_09200 [Armatimonadota bacterium]|jgi:hypothetical protein